MMARVMVQKVLVFLLRRIGWHYDAKAAEMAK